MTVVLELNVGYIEMASLFTQAKFWSYWDQLIPSSSLNLLGEVKPEKPNLAKMLFRSHKATKQQQIDVN